MSDITPVIVMNDCAVMNQFASDNSKAESPMVNVKWANSSNATVFAKELAFSGHIVLRGKPTDDAFMAGAAKVLGTELPGKLSSVESGEYVVRWLSPDTWLITMPGAAAYALETRLRETLTGHYQVVNESGGQTLLVLSGENAENVLHKSVHYDIHISNFPVGKVVNTNFAKTGCTLRRLGEQEFELVVRRSFSDYVAAWIQDAAAEYGFAWQG
ncbi:sarcosine oxidase subunit gamma [Oceanobacter kriegii]|uniref:sarcosine oxidase subunit gamma n=1 Tax=Oceanobacter kriegii TaxID=64972 RepID=UPI0004132BCF|nr:sarcosine oxidase subunit gamma family protein [Oceanobacter kriegii]